MSEKGRRRVVPMSNPKFDRLIESIPDEPLCEAGLGDTPSDLFWSRAETQNGETAE